MRTAGTRRRQARKITSAGLVFVLHARDAFAYTDPGSGALLWQLGAAAVFGVIFHLRRLVTWLSARTFKRQAGERRL